MISGGKLEAEMLRLIGEQPPASVEPPLEDRVAALEQSVQAIQEVVAPLETPAAQA